MGTSPVRVQRVLHGRLDGRLRGNRVPHGHVTFQSQQMDTTLRFLWRKYHFDAEGLPDRFSVAVRDANSMTIGGCGLPNPTVVPARSALLNQGAEETDGDSIPDVLDPAEMREEEERAIAGMALYASTAQEPDTMALIGPGTQWGPLRYIGVMRPVHLHLEMRTWCAHFGLSTPSLQTLLRALKACKCLRFRKVAGEHANCDTCTLAKKQLKSRSSLTQHAEVMEQYCLHLLDQWLDRQVDANHTEASLACRKALDMGQLLNTLGRQLSHLVMRVDGVDQAKFRVPRALKKTHAFDKLIRPALHVQGAWAHGFGFHFAVADADCKKDTNNNVEVMARMLEDIFLKYGGLPKSLYLVQDNTSRECKNQKIVKFFLMLVSLNIFHSVELAFPQKGHTHGPLDGTFGQACVKLANMEFQDDADVVNHLNDFLRDIGIDGGSRDGAKAYKLDESARWTAWAESVGLALSNLTGPEAPHYFRICRRRDVGIGGIEGDGQAEARVQHDSRGLPLDLDDVVMVVKDRMASTTVLQIAFLVASTDVQQLQQLPLQPAGKHERRPASDQDRQKVSDAANAAHQAGAIGDAARDYLMQWAQGTRRRAPRPAQYRFLTHRANLAIAPPPAILRIPLPGAPRPVRIVPLGGVGVLADDPEGADDADPGPLVIF